MKFGKIVKHAITVQHFQITEFKEYLNLCFIKIDVYFL